MDDAFLMRRRETACRLRGVIDRFANRCRPARELLAQRDAFQQLGDEIRRAFMHSKLVDGENIRMVQSRRGAGLLLETAQAIGIARQRGRENLDSDIAPELRIARAIHFAHTSGAERCDDFISSELCPSLKRHLVSPL